MAREHIEMIDASFMPFVTFLTDNFDRQEIGHFVPLDRSVRGVVFWTNGSKQDGWNDKCCPGYE